MNKIFIHLLVVLLVLATAGAVFFCALALMSTMEGMPMNQDGLMSHLLYARELTGAVTDVSLTVSIIASFLAMVIIVFSLFYKFDISLRSGLSGYLKRKYLDGLYIAQSTISRWLSLFEQSPNFIKPA